MKSDNNIPDNNIPDYWFPGLVRTECATSTCAGPPCHPYIHNPVQLMMATKCPK